MFVGIDMEVGRVRYVKSAVTTPVAERDPGIVRAERERDAVAPVSYAVLTSPRDSGRSITPGQRELGPKPRVKIEPRTAGVGAGVGGVVVDTVAEDGENKTEGGRGGRAVIGSAIVTGDLEVMCGELCVGVVVDGGREEVCWVGTVALPSRLAFQST
jgi:hypothetical protein